MTAHPWALPESHRQPRGTGVGSRGGQWHDPEFQARYHREWRAAHPEYRERERLRNLRRRLRGETASHAARQPIPVVLAAQCSCGCGCVNEVPVVACGMCLEGLHE
jgi:hypothetical protein